MEKQIVTFGEIMLRLASPGRERLFQSPRLELTFGGGEANVAVGLSKLGLCSCFVTALPDNSLGDACIGELKKHGVAVDNIIRSGDRLGIYFLEPGANQRPSKVIYDRKGSSFAALAKGTVDWDGIFKNASWFHITGISPAVSAAAAAAALESVEKAKGCDVMVSCDLNFRGKLWKYGKNAPEVMSELVKLADVVVGNEEDCQKSLGFSGSTDKPKGKPGVEYYRTLTDRVMEAYPNLQKIAITIRESISADYNNWSAVLNNRNDFYVSPKYCITDIVDRIGAGDSFACGLIYGLNTFDSDREALDFAAAASCLKHSIPGDFPLFSRDEVVSLMHGDDSGRVQR